MTTINSPLATPEQVAQFKTDFYEVLNTHPGRLGLLNLYSSGLPPEQAFDAMLDIAVEQSDRIDELEAKIAELTDDNDELAPSAA